MNTINPLKSTLISPLRVSANGRHFVDGHNQPLFWLGDTQWELFRLFTPSKALRILKNRQTKGFNVILIMLTGVDAGRVIPDMQAPYTNLEGEQPWIDNDPLKPNERYFQHIDSLIHLGEQTGQIFVVGVYHQWHVDLITLEKARPWARWVAERYRSVPNLVWCMYPKATDAYIPVCRELAAGLQQGDGGAHLISVHPDPSVASSSFIHNEAWLAFNMIQTCIDYDHIVEAVMADVQRTPVKPVVMAEGGYEGLEFNKLQTPHDIRVQAYWTQLAGGYHVYGHNDCWKSPASWEQWIDAPGAGHLQVFRQVVTSCPGWWNLVPDPTLLVNGAGSGYALNTAARSGAGDWALVYLSEPATVTVRLDWADPAGVESSLTPLGKGGKVMAQWIDPTNGVRQLAGIYAPTNPVSLTSPQGWEDAVLLIEAA